jgi:hypothetical protein
MFRVILLIGMLGVLLAAGATTLAFKGIKLETAQQHAARAARAEPIDQGVLRKHLRDLSGEMALP